MESVSAKVLPQGAVAEADFGFTYGGKEWNWCDATDKEPRNAYDIVSKYKEEQVLFLTLEFVSYKKDAMTERTLLNGWSNLVGGRRVEFPRTMLKTKQLICDIFKIKNN